MSPRTTLDLSEAEARASAIAKLDERDRLPEDRLVDAVHVAIFGTPPPRRRPIELLGHHLQRAAAENA